MEYYSAIKSNASESVLIYNGILLSYKKQCIRVSSNEVDELELIMQSEVSQKEKDRYCILTHVYGI